MTTEHGTSTGPTRGPHPARTPYLAVGSVLLVLGLLFAGAPTLSQLVARTSTVRQVYDDVPRRIEVRVSDGLTIEGANTDTIRAQYRLRWSWAQPSIRRHIEDGVMTLRVDCQGTPCGAQARLQVPRSTAVRARVDDAATADVSGIRGGADITGDTGTVNLWDVAGPVRVRVHAGSIEGYRLASDEVEMVSHSGSIFASLTKSPTSLRAQSHIGEVELLLPPGDERYRVDAASDFGTEEVLVPTEPDAERSIEAKTSQGDIRIDHRGG